MRQGSLNIPHNHAYAAGRVDEKSQTIEIINPHDTKNHYIISWSDFINTFEDLNYARV